MFMIEPWHWLVFGMLLIIVDIMVVPTFALLMLGVGAVVMSLIAWIVPLDSVTQVAIWLILSVAFSVLWFKFIKPMQKDRTKAGLGGSAVIGEVGLITLPPVGDQMGKVRFSVPILGADEWLCRSDTELKIGDRVSITQILGNELLVKKTAHQ